MEEIDLQILSQAFRLNRHAILVEGFNPEEYDLVIVRFRDYIEKRCGVSFDFLEVISDDPHEMTGRVRGVENSFIYNLDLFGEGVDPDKATLGMGILRSEMNMARGGIKQLMFARSNANLDYNSRKGYGFHDNHPLGNWCEFYRIDSGKLIQQSNPIKHRE